MIIEQKTCTKCKITQSILNFGKDKNKKDGLQCWCRNCKKIYRENNKDQIASKYKVYRENNKDYLKTYLNKWNKLNPDYHKTYYQNNKTLCKQKTKTWRLKNQEKVFNQNTKRRSKITTELSKEAWIRIMKKTEWKCFYCNTELNKENRTIDHVIPIHSGGTNEENNCVPSCLSCNCSKKDTPVNKWNKFKCLKKERKEYLLSILGKIK